MTREFKEFQLKVDGEEKTYRVYKSSMEDNKQAQRARNAAFSDAITGGAFLKLQINEILKDRNIWNDEKETHFVNLRNQVLEREKRLDEGGFYIGDGRVVALEIRDLRNEMATMLMERNTLNNETAEGQADNMAFNYLISASAFLVYNDGREERVFTSLDDYLANASTETGSKIAQEFYNLTSNLGEDLEKSFPENQFLIEYGFVDENLRYINNDGHLTDIDGKLINEFGQYVDSDENLVDINGDRVDSDGNYKVDKKPFLDKDGKPVKGKNDKFRTDEPNEPEKSTKPKSTKTKKIKTKADSDKPVESA